MKQTSGRGPVSASHLGSLFAKSVRHTITSTDQGVNLHAAASLIGGSRDTSSVNLRLILSCVKST